MLLSHKARDLVVQEFSDKDAAALYSQLTGVLAGFAFAGMIMVVTSRFERSEPADDLAHATTQAKHDAIQVATSRALTLLVSAFFGLVAVSLAYALIGGDQVPGRAAVGHVIAGAGFGSSALVLLLSVFYLIEAADPELRKTLHLVAVRISPLAVAAYIVVGVLDVEQLQGTLGGPELLGAAVLICIPIAGLIFSGRLRGRFADQYWQTSAIRHFATGTLLLTVLCAISIPVLLAIAGDDDSPLLLAWVAAALGVGACAAVTLSTPGAAPPPGEVGQDAVTQTSSN